MISSEDFDDATILFTWLPPQRLCYSDNPPLVECHFSLYFAGPHPLLPENHDPP